MLKQLNYACKCKRNNRFTKMHIIYSQECMHSLYSLLPINLSQHQVLVDPQVQTPTLTSQVLSGKEEETGDPVALTKGGEGGLKPPP